MSIWKLLNAFSSLLIIEWKWNQKTIKERRENNKEELEMIQQKDIIIIIIINLNDSVGKYPNIER